MGTQPRYREAWWCWILGEPMIIEFENDQPKCTNCGMLGDAGESAGKGFLAEHTFCRYIEKPVRSIGA